MKYFFDSSIIIDIQNKKEDAIKRMEEILKKEDTSIYINKLVYIESLRTIPNKNTKIFEKAQGMLNSFEKLEITKGIYDKAVDFSRYCTSKGKNIKEDCLVADFLHFMTAKHYECEMISKDNDMETLREAYLEYKK